MAKRCPLHCKKRLCSLRVHVAIPAVSFFACLIALKCCSAANLDAIQARASLIPAKIQSYQFSAEIRETKGSQIPVITRATFWQAGNFLRSEVEFLGQPAGNHKPDITKVISAYNGVRYQTLYDDEKLLALSSNAPSSNPYFLPNPLIIPYLWLVASSTSMNWSDVKAQSVWSACFSSATYDGEIRENNRLYELVSMPYLNPNSGMKATVYFAKELGYYPLKFTVSDTAGVQKLVVEVLQYRMIESDGTETLFPLVISAHEQASPPVVRVTTISEVSIKVNQTIDEDLFTISPSIAKRVDDGDKAVLKRNNRFVPPTSDTLQPSSFQWRAWLVVANLAAIALLAIVIWYKRRSHA